MRKVFSLVSALMLVLAMSVPAAAVDGRVALCHKGMNTLTVGAAAVPAHLNHGDTLGPCPG